MGKQLASNCKRNWLAIGQRLENIRMRLKTNGKVRLESDGYKQLEKYLESNLESKEVRKRLANN